MATAYSLNLDGQKWLRIEGDDGLEYEEPLSGWNKLHVMMSHDPTELGSWWQHKDGRRIKALRDVNGNTVGSVLYEVTL